MIIEAKEHLKNCAKFVEWKTMNLKKRGKTICVFRNKGGAPGLFSYLISALGFIRYAHNKGLRPVIDLQSFSNTYLANDAVNTLNAWDYFFEQPVGILYNDAIKGENTIILDTTKDNCGMLKSPWWDWDVFIQDSVTCKMWRAYTKRYIRLSKLAEAKLNETWSSLVSPGERVLGILCRGTDYTRHKPKFHPVQPSPEMVIEKAEEMMKRQVYDKIFLATEDGVIFRKFKNHFGNLIISSDNNHIDYDGNGWMSAMLPKNEHGKLQHGMNYLISMSSLARCNSLIAGRTSGSAGVICMSTGFEETYIFDLGVYV